MKEGTYLGGARFEVTSATVKAQIIHSELATVAETRWVWDRPFLGGARFELTTRPQLISASHS